MQEFIVVVEGSIDVEASVEKFRSALEGLVFEREKLHGMIREAVDTTLSLAGGRLPMPTLVGMAVVRLSPADAKEYDRLSKAVESFVKDNLGERGSSARYYAQKGKGGGVGRNPVTE